MDVQKKAANPEWYRIHDKGNLGRKRVPGTSRRARYSHLRANAQRREIPFSLDFDTFVSLSVAPCHYCGTPPTKPWVSHNAQEGFVSHGLDRVDNSLGYVAGNCVPACHSCNNAKHEMGVGEFRAWLERAYGHALLAGWGRAA